MNHAGYLGEPRNFEHFFFRPRNGHFFQTPKHIFVYQRELQDYIYQHLQQVYSSLWTSSPSGASSRTCVRNTENRGRQLQRGSQNHWLGFDKFHKHTKSALHATTGRGPSSLSGPPGMFHIYTQPWLLLWHTLFLFLRR